MMTVGDCVSTMALSACVYVSVLFIVQSRLEGRSERKTKKKQQTTIHKKNLCSANSNSIS